MLKTKLAGIIEKVVMTYIQAFLAVLLAGQLFDVSALTAAGIAAVPAGLTALVAAIPQVDEGLPFYTDLFLRALRTYVVTFIGLFVATVPFDFTVDAAEAAAVGAIPVALSVIKSLVAHRVGDPESAALLPASVDPVAQWD